MLGVDDRLDQQLLRSVNRLLELGALPLEILGQQVDRPEQIDGRVRIRDQLGIFDTLSEKAQREFLEGTIENPADMKKVFGSMLSAWASGDVNTVAKVFNSDFSGSPELRQRLLERRNDNWARWIEKRLAQPGTIMVAVGAGHLAGEDSVISTLLKDGYRVQRVQ
jgi:hypothetical protein